MNILTHSSRDAWLETRRLGTDGNYAITATDAAVILGGHPQMSRVQLYYEKRGEIEPDISPKLRENLDNRRNCEVAMDLMYVRKHPAQNMRDPGDYTIYQHDDYPWMIATLDRTVIETIGDQDRHGVLEYKTVGINKVGEWDDDASDIGCPIENWIQVQHQMAVTGYERGVLFGFTGAFDTIERPVERDDEFIEGLIEEELKFLELLRTGKPPPVDSHKATGEAITRLHPDDNGETVTLSPKAVEAAEELEEVEAQLKELNQQRNLHRNVIMECIGPAATGMGPGFKFTWKTQERKEYVVKASKQRVLRRSKAK